MKDRATWWLKRNEVFQEKLYIACILNKIIKEKKIKMIWTREKNTYDDSYKNCGNPHSVGE